MTVEVIAAWAAYVTAGLMFAAALGMLFVLGWFLKNGSPGDFGPF